MLDDKTASELISKSIHGSLSKSESEEMTQKLDNCKPSQKFAELSRLIQGSVAELGSLAHQGAESIGPGLTDDAKTRLKDSVRFAVQQGMSSSGDLAGTVQIAEGTAGKQSAEEIGVLENQPGDKRQLKSEFTMIRQLGQGGLGNVWLARDEKLNRNVAIKEMNQEALQSPKAWQRFDREAEITGHLEHPNVVSLYQYGIDSKSGEPFYAMRFVGKRTFADAIEEYHDRCLAGKCDPLILHRLLSAFLDVCQAIAYAHSRGVIHRDLKPDNVALDNFGQVIVLDWGLAKLAEEGELGSQLSGSDHDLSEEALAQTMVGEVIGTPLYMSPEQAAGESVCEKTDIYGLGAILFAILSGSAPHESSNRAQDGTLNFKDVLKKIAEGETPSPRANRSEVPIELEAICKKAMARKKYARHESVTELANEVERWIVNQGQRHSEYENIRIEGRELRANFQSAVRDLETNVRFMSKLPPIQEMIASSEDEASASWRERLTTIFSGLLNAKPDYRSVVYSQVDGGQFTELVRVERHSTVHSNIRPIPRSRLRSGEISDFIRNAMQQDPDEVYTSLASNPLCNSSDKCSGEVSLVAGVPVFDQATEESFGVVLIECDLNRVMKDQLNRRFSATDIVFACDTFQVMMHHRTGMGALEESVGQPIDVVLPKFKHAVESLQSQSKLEYIDQTDHLIYGAKLWLVPNQRGVMFLLSQK